MQDFFDWIADKIVGWLTDLINLLPPDPFINIHLMPAKLTEFLGYANYFLPVNWIISALTLWLFAVGGYYLITIALRWIKAIK